MTIQTKIYKQIIFVLLLLLMVIQSCTQPDVDLKINSLNYYEFDLPVKDTNITKICIANPGKTSMKFIFNLNDKFWFSTCQIMAGVLAQKSDSLKNINTKITKAWLFTFLNSIHLSTLDLPADEISGPSIFFNSTGSGMCYNRAYILSQLWRSFGYNSRIVHLGGHAVAEVWENNKWNMFDPDNGIYFTDSLKNIASVAEIAHKSMVLVADTSMASRSIQLLNVIFNQEYFIELFKSTKNNSPEADSSDKFIPENAYFSLPPGSKFEFPVKNPVADADAPFCFGRITIPKSYSGPVDIPFIIHHIEGNGVLVKSNRLVLPVPNSSPYPSGHYYICCDSLKIYVYINPLLINLNKTNKIKIVSNSSIKPVVSFAKNETHIPDFYYSYKINNLLLRHKDMYLNFFKEWPGGADTLNICTLQEFKKNVMFVYKNTFNTTQVPDSIKTKIDSFTNYIEAVYPGLDFSLSIFNNISTFRMISVAIIELNPDHLIKILKYNLSDIKRKRF